MTREEKQKAIDALKISVPIMAVTQEEFNDYIRTLNKVMDWLEQEPNKSEIPTGSTTKNNLGVDAISREQAIEEADKLCLETGYDNEKVIEMLNELPSITPQPRKGHWIRVAGGSLIDDYRCDCCNHQPPIRKVGSTWGWDFTDYCPNCGAKMEEVEA